MKMRVLVARSQNPQSEIRNPQFLGLICVMVFALCSLLLAPCSAVDAQQAGKVVSRRFSGFKQCFRYGGARGRFPARAGQAWMD